MKATLNHHSCYRGKRVALKLGDGTTFEARFLENRSGRMFVRHGDGTVASYRHGEIRQFRVVKGSTLTLSSP